VTLRAALTLLRKRYGPPPSPPTSDPFELVLLENIAYLASPARRLEAFVLLRSTVGTTPAAILKATPKALERVTAKGILKSTFAKKLRACASIALETFGGELGKALRGPLAEAKKALRLFPGVGEPGAEKILLFCGRHALLAPDSNTLRVLVRVGLVPPDLSYAKTYAAARALGEALPPKPTVLQEAHLLLQEHGQTLCKRTAPRCPACPLRALCAYARDSGVTK
jgi:endonuclease III